MWVRHKVTIDPTVSVYVPPVGFWARARRILRRQFIKWTHRRAGLRGEFFADRSQYGGNELAGMPGCDILNVQFAQDFLDLPAFHRAPSIACPVVVTLHEMSPFTGGCSYAGGCSRFAGQCGDCPLVTLRGPGDLSHQGWQRRRTAYARRPPIRLHFVADSHWLAGQALRSSLLRHHTVSVIHYGLDTEVFRPLDRALAREVFRVPSGVRVVSFAAASVTDDRKGMRYLVEALHAMTPRPFLLTWGRDLPTALASIPHLHLGSIGNEHLLSLAYSAADVFVMPSLEEAFGQTALESLACGTPVVAFAAGGIPDSVRHEQTGLLAPVGDASALRAGIERLLSDRQAWDRLSHQARQMVVAEFSLELNARRYLQLYQTMLSNGAARQTA